MTKEEVLNKHDSSRKYIEQTCRPELFSAMDEWAKQQAIAFDTWKRNNKWSYAMDDGSYIKPIGTAGSVGFKFEKASFDDIYNQFIEQQNKGK